MDTQVDMDKVVQILKDKHGIESYVEQTGGGCATIFAGSLIDTEGHFQASAGPGWFEGPGWRNGRGDLTDFYVGLDDDGQSDPIRAEQTWTEADVARVIAGVVNEEPETLEVEALREDTSVFE